MRTLLILVCTINLFLTGCKTGTKHTSCGTSCGSSCATQIGMTTISDQKPETPETETVVKASHANDKANPFEDLKDLVPATAEQPAPEPEARTVPTPENGHAKDYRWLIGRLQRVHSPKHEWKLRYAGLDEEDEWGGSMILAQDARLDEWNDGDLVYVEGEILRDRPSVYLAGPLYRVRAIHPISEVTFIVPRD